MRPSKHDSFDTKYVWRHYMACGEIRFTSDEQNPFPNTGLDSRLPITVSTCHFCQVIHIHNKMASYMKTSEIPLAKIDMSVEPNTESEYFEFSTSRSFSTFVYDSNKATSNIQISVIPYTEPQCPVKIIFIKNDSQCIYEPNRCACDKCQLGRQCKKM